MIHIPNGPATQPKRLSQKESKLHHIPATAPWISTTYFVPHPGFFRHQPDRRPQKVPDGTLGLSQILPGGVISGVSTYGSLKRSTVPCSSSHAPRSTRLLLVHSDPTGRSASPSLAHPSTTSGSSPGAPRDFCFPGSLNRGAIDWE